MYQNIPKYLRILFVFFIIPFYTQESEADYNCFSILVGKNATTDGSVFLAHNEDDSGNRVVNWYKVPRVEENRSDFITLKRGAKVPQLETRNSYLWLEIPELEFSDTYMNELGVTITSDGCPSKEDEPELVDGGIGYWLRRLMIERAFTAKEAVTIGGKLIEEYGYASSGRTYAIAGPYETWLLSVVNGKHWVAQKVPDNHVAIIPNYYTITKVDLSDTSNFLGSKDIISYATERGWYNPDTDGEFNFRKAYGTESSLSSRSNQARHWVALNTLSNKQYQLEDDFPFSFVPKKKLSLKHMFKLLRNHYEGTPLDESMRYTKENPHKQSNMSICSNTNQYGFVAQLRSAMPIEIGAVLWIAPTRPCNNPFIPIYSGITKTPENFSIHSHKKALVVHFNELKSFYPYVNHYHMRAIKKRRVINDFYKKNIPNARLEIKKIETNYLESQDKFEKKILKLYINDFDKATEKLTKYSLKAVANLFDK